jgi:hypothetical protein
MSFMIQAPDVPLLFFLELNIETAARHFTTISIELKRFLLIGRNLRFFNVKKISHLIKFDSMLQNFLIFVTSALRTNKIERSFLTNFSGLV